MTTEEREYIKELVQETLRAAGMMIPEPVTEPPRGSYEARKRDALADLKRKKERKSA